MTAGNQPDPGYGSLEFNAIVERELKSLSITPEDLVVLTTNKVSWKATLKGMKKRTETQMTSSKARSYELYVQLRAGKLTPAEYRDRLHQEKVWRCGATRFLQQVEEKLQSIKLHD